MVDQVPASPLEARSCERISTVHGNHRRLRPSHNSPPLGWSSPSAGVSHREQHGEVYGTTAARHSAGRASGPRTTSHPRAGGRHGPHQPLLRHNLDRRQFGRLGWWTDLPVLDHHHADQPGTLNGASRLQVRPPRMASAAVSPPRRYSLSPAVLSRGSAGSSSTPYGSSNTRFLRPVASTTDVTRGFVSTATKRTSRPASSLVVGRDLRFSELAVGARDVGVVERGHRAIPSVAPEKCLYLLASRLGAPFPGGRGAMSPENSGLRPPCPDDGARELRKRNCRAGH